MSNDEFILGQGLGHQLELAFRRNGWSAADVHTICAGDILGRIRKQMLRSAEPLPALNGILDRGPLFHPWKTIIVGTRTADEVIRALLDDEYGVDEEAQVILRASSFAVEPTQVNLANLTHRDLGYEDGEIPHYAIASRRIRHMGFELCTPEMAAELRLLNFDDQNDRLTLMAMIPIEGQILEQYLNDREGKLELGMFQIDDGATWERTDYICIIP